MDSPLNNTHDNFKEIKEKAFKAAYEGTPKQVIDLIIKYPKLLNEVDVVS